MAIFVYQDGSGSCAVISADNPEEALELLRKKEGPNDEYWYLSNSIKPSDLKEHDGKKGVLAYSAH